MTHTTRKLWWFIGVPVIAAVFFAGSMALFITMLGLGESLVPLSPWTTVPIAILFAVITPFAYAAGLIERFTGHAPAFLYPAAFILSAILWGCIVVWMITRKRSQKTT